MAKMDCMVLSIWSSCWSAQIASLCLFELSMITKCIECINLSQMLSLSSSTMLQVRISHYWEKMNWSQGKQKRQEVNQGQSAIHTPSSILYLLWPACILPCFLLVGLALHPTALSWLTLAGLQRGCASARNGLLLLSTSGPWWLPLYYLIVNFRTCMSLYIVIPGIYRLCARINGSLNCLVIVYSSLYACINGSLNCLVIVFWSRDLSCNTQIWHIFLPIFSMCLQWCIGAVTSWCQVLN